MHDFHPFATLIKPFFSATFHDQFSHLTSSPPRFQRRNAFIVPVVYFFYPETSGRSLEEMDTIFRKCHSCFTLVRIAHEEPRRFGRKGEILINYEETEEHAVREARVAGGAGMGGGDIEKNGTKREVENVT